MIFRNIYDPGRCDNLNGLLKVIGIQRIFNLILKQEE